ncbi:MAG: hypothetical protein HKO07_03560 [Pseudomonadales bacterium]|nr:hypothetical protein [Gammaproteobacteria bacterium]NNC54782.1 hypothetical protein [Pseudomonadales bacterium]NNF16012.1 hypothetical protein [Gammaproteobacteria bacterium]
MLFNCRKYYLALVLVTVIGSVEFSVHSATHITTDLATCEVCNGQPNPAFVMDDGNHTEPAPAPAEEPPASASLPAATNPNFTLHQPRAPPVIS